MPRFNPEASAFFEKNLKKQATPEQAPAEPNVDIEKIDMSPEETVAAYQDVCDQLTDLADQQNKPPAEIIESLDDDSKKKRAFLDRLPRPAKKLVLALGMTIFLGTAATSVEAGQYRRSGTTAAKQEKQPFFPFKWVKEKVAPELSLVQRAEREIMFGTPKRNPDGSEKYDNKYNVIRENNGLIHELGKEISGSWRNRTTEQQEIRQFEISDNFELFAGWSIQEKKVNLPDGKVFDYYGPWPNQGCGPAEFLMYTTGYLNSFPTGPFPSKNVRAWRPGRTVPPQLMADRYYHSQKLRSDISKGFTPDEKTIELDDVNFWVMWEMYRSDQAHKKYLTNSALAKKIENYRQTFWQEGWSGRVNREKQAKEYSQQQSQNARQENEAKAAAARAAQQEKQKQDKRNARSRTGIR